MTSYTRAGGRAGADNLGGARQGARWAQAVIYLAIGGALVAALLQSFFSVRAASRAIARAQGESLMRPIRHAQPPGEPVTQLTLDRLVERYRDLGLRCIAVFDQEGRAARRAGNCETPEHEMEYALLESRPGQVVDFGSRVRIVDRMPPPPPPRPPERSGGRDQPPRHRRWPPEHPRPDRLLIEFEPVMANQLQASATRSLVIGLAATLALVAAAFVFWRLSQRAERLQQALERDRRLAGLGQMSAILAHEIRNPLASLKGHAQLLAEKLEPEGSDRGKADRIVGEAVRLERLCEDLLSLARPGQIELAEIDPAALLREAAASASERHFEMAVSEAPRRWQLDPRRMHQVLTNLLRNAAQASPHDRPPEASVHVEGDQLVFSVRDFGAGVSPGEESRIFEPFHTTRVRGTGLGLAVAKGIVELHGGSVTVRNHPEGGAVFRVVVPKS